MVAAQPAAFGRRPVFFLVGGGDPQGQSRRIRQWESEFKTITTTGHTVDLSRRRPGTTVFRSRPRTTVARLAFNNHLCNLTLLSVYKLSHPVMLHLFTMINHGGRPRNDADVFVISVGRSAAAAAAGTVRGPRNPFHGGKKLHSVVTAVHGRRRQWTGR